MAKKGLNLIRAQLAPQTSWDRVYKWMLTTARVVIIIVEVVVMVAFVFRIGVDTQANNLDKAVDSKNAELSAYRLRELEFRRIQEKTAVYRDLWVASSDKAKYMAFINNILGNVTGEVSIGIEDREITIRGLLPISEINNLELALKEAVNPDPNSGSGQAVSFRKVELVEVNSRSAGEGDVAEFFIRIELIQVEEKRSI